MSRRIDIELTSSREDGSWTWRAAGAREPRGTVDGAILPAGAEVGQVLRAEVEGYLDGMDIVAVLPPRAPRSEPERLELKSARTDQPLVTSTLAARRPGGRSDERSGERGRRRPERGREGDRPRRDRRGARDRQDARHERPSRPAPPPVEDKPKPKRLRPGKAHRSALLEAVPAEQRPIAEQLLAGGIPSVRQAIDKQNEALRAEGKPEVKPDALLRVAEDLRPRALTAAWRDRAEAAAAVVDDLDLRDLRSVVNAAGDAGRDDEARALAAQLREALANRVEKEHAAWLAELAETVQAGRVVRALRLSSRPPKAGAPIPGDIATQLAEATAASLTDETGPERWATVLDALAYSPVRRRVIPQSLPTKLSPDLRSTIARLASRLPDIAHIFDIEPDPAAERAARGQARRRPGRSPDDRRPDDRKDRKDDRRPDDRKGARKPDDRKSDQPKADRRGRGKGGDKARKADTDTRRAPTPEAAVPGPEAAAPEAPALEAVESEAAGPEAAESEAPAPQAAESEAPAPEAAESEAAESEAPADTTDSAPAAAGGDEPGVEAESNTQPGGDAAPDAE
ncbi:MAG TPA: hypothetical protein VF015_01890 [Acidimicrobiales bacterium]